MSISKRLSNIEGIIVASTWDEDGTVKGISLHTADEEEYRIESNGVGRDLLAHIHSKVVANGRIRERLDGHLYFNVLSYETVGESPADGAAEA